MITFKASIFCEVIYKPQTIFELNGITRELVSREILAPLPVEGFRKV